jgi:hypothetical protein
LNYKDLVFDGQVETEKRINLLYDNVTHHYHVINSITGALSREFVCKGCNKGCQSGVIHRCQEACSDVCQFSNVHTMMVESRASRVIDSSGVAHILTNIKRTRWEIRLLVQKRETVLYTINS